MFDPVAAFDLGPWTMPQRLELIARLWDSMPDSLADMPVPEWHRAEVERRLAAADADPAAGIPWPEAREALRRTP